MTQSDLQQPTNTTPQSPLADSNTADAVEYLNTLELTQATDILDALERSRAVKILERPELERGAALVSALPLTRAADLLGRMANDRATDIVQDLDEDEQARLVPLLPVEARSSIRKLLSYPPQTAGSLMTTEFVTVGSDWTVGQTLQHVREVERERETVYAIYILDPGTRRLQRVVTLRRLITGNMDDLITSVAHPNPPITVDPLLDREEVVRLIRRHDLLALPVVDARHQVIGIVTVDDVLDALTEESTEDVHKFGGSEALEKPYMHISLFDMLRKRAGWLSILLLGEMLTTSAMQYYQHELAQAMVLTLFIPLIMSSGGNSGSQATSLLIRSLALQEIKLRDWWRVAMRELPTGLMLGAILGLLSIIRVVAWQWLGFHDYGEHWVLIAATVGCALMGIVTFGSLAGAMLPFVMQKLGFDPASASAPFVATLVDVTGLVIYFSIAALILSGTLL